MSQSNELLSYLRRGHKITSLTALRHFSTLRLSGRIFDLRQAGHKIKTTMVTTAGGKRIASYSL